MKKRLISLLLSVAVLTTSIPVSTFADNPVGQEPAVTSEENEERGIDYKKNGKWYRLESKIKNEVTVRTSDNTMENGDNAYTQEINWEKYYGKLDKGHYRIVKEVKADLYIVAEFDI